MKIRYLSIAACCFWSCLLLTTSCRNNTDDDIVVGKDQDEFSAEEQVVIGESLAQNLATRTDIDLLEEARYPDVYDYLNTIFATLVQTPGIIHRKEFNWRVVIIQDDDRQSAFTGPGGTFYIYTGLLKYLQSEDELLGVMAHELNYLDQGKILEELKAKFGGSVLADILLSNEVDQLSEMADYLSEIRYSVSEVINADTLAVETLCPFLYDARGLQRIFERATTQTTDSQIEWMQVRPGDLKERIRHVVRNARDCGMNGAHYEDRYFSYIRKLP